MKRTTVALIVDVAERATLVTLFINAVTRLVPGIGERPFNTIYLLEQLVTVSLIVTRRAGAIALAPYPIFIAFVGTALPLLANGSGEALVSPAIGALVMLAGLFVSLSAKLSLNRSFGFLVANRGVKRAWAYSIVRHPMYLGYAVTQTGFLLINPSPWNISLITATWAFQIFRINAEETYLSCDEAYRAYKSDVRYRLLPGVF